MTRSEHWSSILARPTGMLALLTLLVTAAAQAQTFTVLHSFTGLEGANPYSGLIMDQAGRLYGTAFAGGAHGFGTVYRNCPRRLRLDSHRTVQLPGWHGRCISRRQCHLRSRIQFVTAGERLMP